MTTHVLYHHPCTDGFAAAFAAWLALGDGAAYHGVNYSGPLPEIADGDRVYLLDFSIPRADLEALAARCEVTVLDHHKSAQADLEGLPYAHFDMDKSGAVLSWEHFHHGQSLPALFAYVQDRDLWRWQLPMSRQVSAALRVYDQDFALWEILVGDEKLSRLKADGDAILSAQRRDVESLLSHARLEYVEGHRVPVVNTALHISETGEALCERYPDAPFAATYYAAEDGYERWSLRSRNGFDVSEVARALGGGGHSAAAGFRRLPVAF